MFPHATHAWRRLKLLLAEVLVLSTAKGDHSIVYMDRVIDAADSIKEFREMHYPRHYR